MRKFQINSLSFLPCFMCQDGDFRCFLATSRSSVSLSLRFAGPIWRTNCRLEVEMAFASFSLLTPPPTARGGVSARCFRRLIDPESTKTAEHEGSQYSTTDSCMTGSPTMLGWSRCTRSFSRTNRYNTTNPNQAVFLPVRIFWARIFHSWEV